MLNEEAVRDQAGPIVDPNFLIGLLRAFLPASHQHQPDEDGIGTENGSLQVREQAGEALWDAAASATQAAELACLGFVEYAPALLYRALQHDQLRLVELTVGILANLACHEATVSLVAGDPSIRGLAIELLNAEQDAPCLIETCRLVNLCILHAPASDWQSNTKQAYSR